MSVLIAGHSYVARLRKQAQSSERPLTFGFLGHQVHWLAMPGHGFMGDQGITFISALRDDLIHLNPAVCFIDGSSNDIDNCSMANVAEMTEVFLVKLSSLQQRFFNTRFVISQAIPRDPKKFPTSLDKTNIFNYRVRAAVRPMPNVSFGVHKGFFTPGKKIWDGKGVHLNDDFLHKYGLNVKQFIKDSRPDLQPVRP